MTSIDKNALIWLLQSTNKSDRVSFSEDHIQTLFDGEFISFDKIERAYDKFSQDQQDIVNKILKEQELW